MPSSIKSQLHNKPTWMILLLGLPVPCALLISGWSSGESIGSAPGSVHDRYGKPKQICELKCRSVRESSGIAASRLNQDRFWTHNDSGDRPRLFSFDIGGNHLGTCRIEDSAAVDWEDIAAFEWDGKGYLLIGDVGDNLALRKYVALYLVVEESPDVEIWRVAQTVKFTYQDKPHDCESIAFNPLTRQVFLITKDWELTSKVFALEWPEKPSTEILKATHVATLPYPGVTAMDISPDGQRAIVLTYSDAIEYSKLEEESWAQTFSRNGRLIKMPKRRQGEAICYALDGWTLFLTDEASPTPLYRIPIK